MKNIYILAIMAILVTGCNVGTKSVDYYSKNIDEAQTKVSECRKDPNAETDQNCRNAHQAAHEAKQKQLYKIPTKEEIHAMRAKQTHKFGS